MLLLSPETWKSHGGIQRYMQILASILPERGEQHVVLTLGDAEWDLPDQTQTFHAICCRGSKFRFCFVALRLAVAGRARTTIVGHVAFLPVVWALRRLRMIDQYVVVLHGIEAWVRLPWIHRAAARDAHALIATTRYTAREFCFHNKIDEARCRVIPLGCNFSVVPNNYRGIGCEMRLITVARLSSLDAYKGIDTSLAAVRRGRAAGLNLTLDVIGDGTDRTRLETLASSFGIRDVVRFRGSVADDELQALLMSSHVFVMPSQKEGFGIVFLEAMAAGLPCIGANHAGTPEVIEHGESGFLTEYGDVDQLVFYLRMLFESPELYKAISCAARTRVADTFSLAAMIRSWLRVLQDVAANHALVAENQELSLHEQTQAPYLER